MSPEIARGYPLTAAQREQIGAAHERMKARARAKGISKRLSYAAQSAVLWPLIRLLQILPLDQASAAAAWFGRNVLFRFGNPASLYPTLQVAFPDKPKSELDAILLEMCDNVARVAAETAHLTEFSGADNARLKLLGLKNLNGLVESGRPVLFLGGHFGNWELLTVAVRAAGLDGILVVQHPNNPHVLRWLAAQRLQSGLSGQVAAEEGVYATLRRHFKAGGCALILSDQRVLNGIRAPFFEIETMTNVIPARLARDFDATVVPMSNRRIAGAHFEIEFHEPWRVARGDDRTADELAFTTRMNTFFANEIRERPGYWLWGHPRFDDALGRLGKSSPGGETAAGGS